jgi:hypothetical protein
MNTFTCEWLIDTGQLTEDAEPIILECGAPARGDDHGWACDAGHSHVYAERRYAEGWDYASDPGEAAQLIQYGTFPVLMDGTGPFHP